MVNDKNPSAAPPNHLGISSCQVSDAGGAAVNSPHGPGGARARRFRFGGTAERSTRTFSDARSRKEKPISEVPHAGQDEFAAGAGAVPVTVTPSELGRARVVGQVREGVCSANLPNQAPQKTFV